MYNNRSIQQQIAKLADEERLSAANGILTATMIMVSAWAIVFLLLSILS